jgi:hypothetical protein
MTNKGDIESDIEHGSVDLELSKTLWELSGWKNEEQPIHPDWDSFTDLVPAYDLGYLLRKLPPVLKEDGDNFHLCIMANATSNIGKWFADYLNIKRKQWLLDSKEVDSNADNPTDAACKLAIELFKQGILK